MTETTKKVTPKSKDIKVVVTHKRAVGGPKGENYFPGEEFKADEGFLEFLLKKGYVSKV